MNDRQFTLEHRLLQLRDEIKALKQASSLSSDELSKRLKGLLAERSKLEDELINLVVNPENSYRAEALDGLKEGLLVAVQSLEETLRGARLPEDLPRPEHHETKHEGWLTYTFTWLSARPVIAWSVTGGFIYMLLIAVSALGNGFNDFFGGPQAAQELFAFATNPFMGLLMGLLATAVIQSSSVTTSILVALCAAGTFSISTALPMVLGANIGTSVTNTLVSLGHIGHRREFRRAFAAATVHDFFNMTAVCIFLPLEMAFGILEKLSGWITGMLYGSGSLNLDSINIIAKLTEPVEAVIHTTFKLIPGPAWVSNGAYIVFGLALIFISIVLLGKLLRQLLTGRAEKMFHAATGRSGLAAIGCGCLITVLVQSSSTTTSLIVPLAGAGLMKLKRVFPFTLGANIGTCITALLAAMAITGEGAHLALQIALVHFLFNTLGVAIIYGLPFLRRIPMICASSLAKLASYRRSMALLYIIGVFFLLPLACLGIYKLFE